MMEEDLVSIIVPVYNAEKFIEDTIKTIMEQTYKNWEALFIDDQSVDDSVNIIKRYTIINNQIKLIKNSENKGAAISRNNGIKQARGKYIAFLDADDLWDKEKLEKQINFMKKNDCAFSFTGYQFADENGKPTGKKVCVPTSITYKQALKNTTISTITVIFNMNKLTKEDIYMPNVKNEDTATWWKILRKGYTAYGINEIMSLYRRSGNTTSSNKFKSNQE